VTVDSDATNPFTISDSVIEAKGKGCYELIGRFAIHGEVPSSRLSLGNVSLLGESHHFAVAVAVLAIPDGCANHEPSDMMTAPNGVAGWLG
jgi:hypothetical protein